MAFSLNQKVVYPMQGVGEVQRILERSFKGEDVQYYDIYFQSNDMRVMVPITKIEELNIRAVVSQEEALEALTKANQESLSEPNDWKKRYEINHKLLKNGDVLEVAQVFKALYHRSRNKELPIQEKKLLDSSQLILQDELCLALNKTSLEVKELIESHLMN